MLRCHRCHQARPLLAPDLEICDVCAEDMHNRELSAFVSALIVFLALGLFALLQWSC